MGHSHHHMNIDEHITRPLPPPTKLDGGNVFTPVCVSVCLVAIRIGDPDSVSGT